MMGDGGMMDGISGLGGFGGLGNIGGLLMGFGLMGIVPLAILGVVIWLVVEATRGRSSEPAQSTAVWVPDRQTYPGSAPAGPVAPAAAGAGPDSAVAILDRRYARGEIDREEYVTRKADLTG